MPAMACLSSRFPYGTPITAEKLQQLFGRAQLVGGLDVDRVKQEDVAKSGGGAPDED